jgi:hypothetical protein
MSASGQEGPKKASIVKDRFGSKSAIRRWSANDRFCRDSDLPDTGIPVIGAMQTKYARHEFFSQIAEISTGSLTRLARKQIRHKHYSRPSLHFYRPGQL